MKQSVVIKELEKIRVANGGTLLPEEVVNAARPKTSPLHSQFEWDDSKAAGHHRLWQARQLITIALTIIPSSNKKEQMYVSLKSDRSSGAGYRPLVKVLEDEDLRAMLLQDAFEDMKAFQKKYKHLNELAGVFAAMDAVK